MRSYFKAVCFKHVLEILLINGRKALAEAVIGLLLAFLLFKEFELYWDAVFS